MSIQTIQQAAQQLRLSGLIQSLEIRLHEASANRLTHAEFLELIFQDELAVRRQRAIERRQKSASFRETRTLEDFDFVFNESIKRSRIYELATCRFIAEARDILFCGPPRVGKSHLAQAIGYRPSSRGTRSFTRASSTWCAT